jgi:hypothetical protein
MIPSKTLRSLNVLRQLSGLTTIAMAPHAAYMKVTTLELEKLRLNKAREHALRRVAEIDARLHELDAQKAALLGCLGPARTPSVAAKGLRPGIGRVRLTY